MAGAVVFDFSLMTYEIRQEFGFRMLCLREGKANPFMRECSHIWPQAEAVTILGSLHGETLALTKV